MTATLDHPPAWKFTLTCHYCGALCTPRTTSLPTGLEHRLIVDCTECDGEMLIVVVLSPRHRNGVAEPCGPPRRKTAVCGTTGGYAAHRRRGEVPCPLCKAAHAEGERRRKARRGRARSAQLALGGS